MLLGYQTKEDELDDTCCMHDGDEECVQNFSRKTLKTRPIEKFGCKCGLD